MARSDEGNLKAYLAETASWETDKILELCRSRQWAWRVASATTVLAMLSTAAVLALTPLKTSEPFVIRVDNSTGVVDVVRSLKQGETNHEESLNKYFLQLYVRNREGFNKETAAETYYSVGILSGSSEQQKFQEYFQPKNSRSPLNVYGQYAKVRISIKGVSFVKPTVALVRYAKEIERSGDRPEISHWAATVTFKYVGTPMSEKDRAFNPLGFQVTDYRADPESLTAVERKAFIAPAPVLAPSSALSEQTRTDQPGVLPIVPAIEKPEHP